MSIAREDYDEFNRFVQEYRNYMQEDPLGWARAHVIGKFVVALAGLFLKHLARHVNREV